MSLVHKSTIDANRTDLLEVLHVSNLLLTELCGEDILDQRTKQEILAGGIQYEINGRFLDWLRQSQPSTFKVCLEKFRDDQQNHIANLLDETPGERPLTKEKRQQIQKNIRHLSEVIDVDTGLLALLYSMGAISTMERQEIDSEKVDQLKAMKLLQVILRKSDRALKSFVDALKETNQSHVISTLEKGNIIAVHAEFRSASDLIDQFEKNLIDFFEPLAQQMSFLDNEEELAEDVQPIIHELQEFCQKGIKILRMKKGKSITIYLWCEEVKAMTELLLLFETRHLERILEKIFCLVKTSVKVSNVLIRVTLAADDLQVLKVASQVNEPEQNKPKISVKDSIIESSEYITRSPEKVSAMSRLSDITECCICLKTYTDPRMLPCIHTFCLQCLKDLNDKSNRKARDEISCPVCRNKFTIPNDGVQGIQKNFFMAGMIEVRNALNQSQLTVIPCDACKVNTGATEASLSEATLKCLGCKQNLCEHCRKIHEACEGSKNHKILKISDGIGVEEEAAVTVNAMNCDIHAGKILDYYCVECKKVVCTSCIPACHREHEYKEVAAVEKEFHQMIKFNADKISSLAVELLSMKDTLESKEDLVGKMAKREQEILQRSEELKKMIDEHTNSLLSSLDKIMTRRMNEIKIKEEELHRRLSILESFSRYCDDLLSKGSAIDVCRNKDELLRQADELEEDHETYIMRPKTSFDVTLQATDLTEFLKTTNGNMIGSLNERSECPDDFAVLIGRVDKRPVLCEINLHRKNEVSSFVAIEPTSKISAPAAAVYKNTMFVTGFGKSFNEIWKYSYASGWKRCGTLVHKRNYHCVEFIGETCYICGGCFGKAVLDNIESYNALTKKSAVVGQLRCSVFDAACVAYRGSIYAFGGFDFETEPLDCVQVFNPSDRTCTLLLTRLPCPSGCLRAVSWENFAILMTNGSCFIFDLEGKTWHTRNQFKMDGNPVYFGMILYNKRLFVINGAPRENKDNVRCIRAQCIVNNETPNWKNYGDLLTPCNVMTIAQLSSGKQSS